jgi:hypothetical protein
MVLPHRSAFVPGVDRRRAAVEEALALLVAPHEPPDRLSIRLERGLLAWLPPGQDRGRVHDVVNRRRQRGEVVVHQVPPNGGDPGGLQRLSRRLVREPSRGDDLVVRRERERHRHAEQPGCPRHQHRRATQTQRRGDVSHERSIPCEEPRSSDRDQEHGSQPTRSASCGPQASASNASKHGRRAVSSADHREPALSVRKATSNLALEPR